MYGGEVARNCTLPRGRFRGCQAASLAVFGADHIGLVLALQLVVLALDVDCGRVVQQPIQDRQSDHVFSEVLSPDTGALVWSQYVRTLFVALANQMKQA